MHKPFELDDRSSILIRVLRIKEHMDAQVVPAHMQSVDSPGHAQQPRTIEGLDRFGRRDDTRLSWSKVDIAFDEDDAPGHTCTSQL